MSKKLIAVASAAALALSALVAMPAMATSQGFVVTATKATNAGGTGNGDSSAAAILNAALEANELSVDDVTTITVDGNVAGTSFSVASTGGVLLVTDVTDSDAKALPLTAGTASLASATYGKKDTLNSNKKTFYAYTTSTTPGKVTVTSSTGATQVIWVASEVGMAYNISATFPTTLPVSATAGTATVGAKVYLNVTDVFGNPVTGGATGNATAAGFTPLAVASGKVELKAVGATIAGGTAWTWDTTRKSWKNDLGLVSAKSGSYALSLELTGDPDLTDAGLPSAKTTAFSTTSAQSLEDQVKALTAQVTALQAQLEASRPKATSVTKKKYNTLARKWNAANPSARVALKK
jgi:hypothetical protein